MAKQTHLDIQLLSQLAGEAGKALDDALKLFHRLKETLRRLLVGYLPGQQEAAAERCE